MRAKKITRKITNIIMAGLGAVLVVACLSAGRYLDRKGGAYLKPLTIQSEGGGFDTRWLQEILGEETGPGEEGTEEAGAEIRDDSFAAWTQCCEESLSPVSGGGNCIADVIAVYGPSYCVFPVGRNLSASDPEGCIIGQKLSEDLFGSDHSEGETLVWREQTWTVRGIVEEPAELCILQAAGRVDALTFDRISISVGSRNNRRQMGETFIQQQGLDAHVLRFDYLYGTEWLSEIIPSRWSDLDGWRQNLEERNREALLAKKAERTVIEDAGLEYQKWGRGWMIAGLVLAVIGLIGMRRHLSKTEQSKSCEVLEITAEK